MKKSVLRSYARLIARTGVNIQKGQEVTYEEILQDILRRDQQDSSRAAAPLRKADDAVLIDSTNLTFEQTVDAIKKLIVQRAAALSLSI